MAKPTKETAKTGPMEPPTPRVLISSSEQAVEALLEQQPMVPPRVQFVGEGSGGPISEFIIPQFILEAYPEYAFAWKDPKFMDKHLASTGAREAWVLANRQNLPKIYESHPEMFAEDGGIRTRRHTYLGFRWREDCERKQERITQSLDFKIRDNTERETVIHHGETEIGRVMPAEATPGAFTKVRGKDGQFHDQVTYMDTEVYDFTEGAGEE